MIKVYGVRCYARRLGASGCNAHAKAQAALGPGLRRTSHAIRAAVASPLSFFFFLFHYPLVPVGQAVGVGLSELKLAGSY